MLVERLQLGQLETNCWLVSDGCAGPVIVIDPGDEPGRVLKALAGRPVEAVVLTHAHFDHLGAARGVLEATRAPLLVHEADADRVTSDEAAGTGGALFGFFGVVAPRPDRVLADGDVATAGRVRFTVLHTPGHTQGGICLFAEDDERPAHLFSGDTLFAGSVGRTDFPGGDARALSRSIAAKLAPLPPDTIVHPGHGPDTTLARECRINPFWPKV